MGRVDVGGWLEALCIVLCCMKTKFEQNKVFHLIRSSLVLYSQLIKRVFFLLQFPKYHFLVFSAKV